MKNENMRVAMVRLSDSFVPFVQVDYLDKDAKEHSGMMMLDSASKECILFSEMNDMVGNLEMSEGERTRINTISHEVVETIPVKFSFAMGGNLFQEEFCLCNAYHVNYLDSLPFIGILGHEFMQSHSLVIDYRVGILHTSTISPANLSISDCDYFFPLEIGLKYYGVPVVAIKQNGKEIVTIVDTGATNNAITKQSILDHGFKHKYLDSKDTIDGLSGQVDVEDAVVGFNLLTLRMNDVEEIYHQDLFKVLPYFIMPAETLGTDENDEPLPPAEALVGSSFIASQGWVLDFGAKIIYKLKEPLKEAV